MAGPRRLSPCAIFLSVVFQESLLHEIALKKDASLRQFLIRVLAHRFPLEASHLPERFAPLGCRRLRNERCSRYFPLPR